MLFHVTKVDFPAPPRPKLKECIEKPTSVRNNAPQDSAGVPNLFG
jgi:hypothetical protein